MGHTPTAVLLNDPSRTEWTPLDYKLLKAYELRQTYGDIPPWIDRSDRVTFEVSAFVSNSEAALARRQERDSKRAEKKKQHGVKYSIKPVTKDGGPMPTMAEYIEEQSRKQGRQSGW